MNKLISVNKITEVLGVCQDILYCWELKEKIKLKYAKQWLMYRRNMRLK